MSESRHAEIRSAARAVLERYAQRGLFTHAYFAVGALDRNETISAQVAPSDVASTRRTIFDLASMTKALVTTPLVLAAIEERALPRATTVGAWLDAALPTLDERLRALRVDELLGHASGLPAWRNFWMCALSAEKPPADEPRSAVHARALATLNRASEALSPRNGPVYSDVGFILLGLCLEVTSGEDLASSFASWRARSLGAASPREALMFAPQARAVRDAVVPTSFCAIRGRELCGEVHDENAASFGGISAHAGLFGTGDAVVTYLRALASHPAGQRVLAANAALRALPVPTPPRDFLAGWRQGDGPVSRPFGDGRAMGHQGFTGTSFLVDPEERRFVVILTNRVISGRIPREISDVRRELHTLANTFSTR